MWESKYTLAPLPLRQQCMHSVIADRDKVSWLQQEHTLALVAICWPGHRVGQCYDQFRRTDAVKGPLYSPFSNWLKYSPPPTPGQMDSIYETSY